MVHEGASEVAWLRCVGVPNKGVEGGGLRCLRVLNKPGVVGGKGARNGGVGDSCMTCRGQHGRKQVRVAGG